LGIVCDLELGAWDFVAELGAIPIYRDGFCGRAFFGRVPYRPSFAAMN